MIIAIDSYLSNDERVDVCRNLIKTIRETTTIEILLINKHSKSRDLDVDHYFGTNSNFMVGKPPQELLDQNIYETPYTYVNTAAGVFENWHPLEGVSDHVASVFNTFVISSKIAESLGHSKILRIEYDTQLHQEDLRKMIEDLASAKDYVLYGKRKEGEWAKDYHYLVDVHVTGHNARIFSDEKILRNDNDFWDLCKRINYYGKWIEYVIPSLIESKRSSMNISGFHTTVSIRDMFYQSKFDIVRSSGYFGELWDTVPKICRLSYPGIGEQYDKIGLFYWNDLQDENSIVKCSCRVVNEQKDTVYERQCDLRHRNWIIDVIDVADSLEFRIETLSNDRGCHDEVIVIDREKVHAISNRFAFS